MTLKILEDNMHMHNTGSPVAEVIPINVKQTEALDKISMAIQ